MRNLKKLDLDFLFKALIIIILWATPPLVSKLWVGSKSTFPGLYFGFLRYIFGFFALLMIVGFQNNIGNIILLLKSHFKPILFCSGWLVLMIIGQNFSVLFILGASSSVLLNFNPSIIYLVAPLLFLDEKYTKKKTLGFVLSTLGIGIVFLASLESNSMITTDYILGYCLGFLSGVAWAGYSLSLKRYFQDSQSQEVTTLNLFVAGAILLIVSTITETPPSIESYTVESIWGIVVIGIGAAAIAFTLYLQLVQKYGATRAGNIQFLIPLISLFFALVFLNEYSFYTLVGGIFCAIGVAIVNYEKNEISSENQLN
ncbi:MAG: DMT family transporter [Candidatus Heimdallarchaeota archaeon]|nr:MAG: DMT family transporter [Candidatus Heimdallarchaeota archaeon]